MDYWPIDSGSFHLFAASFIYQKRLHSSVSTQRQTSSLILIGLRKIAQTTDNNKQQPSFTIWVSGGLLRFKKIYQNKPLPISHFLLDLYHFLVDFWHFRFRYRISISTAWDYLQETHCTLAHRRHFLLILQHQKRLRFIPSWTLLL